MTVVLPWPPKELNPNARVHPFVAIAARKAYKNVCQWQGIEQGLKRVVGVSTLHVDLTFYPPDRRRRDLDNMLSSMKSGLDGLRDVLGVDDSNWSLSLRKADTVKVRITG